MARSAITRGIVAYLTHVNTAYRVTHLYANEIYTRHERHAMILVSWIETFIFIRGVIIQMKSMKWYNNIFFDKWIPPVKYNSNSQAKIVHGSWACICPCSCSKHNRFSLATPMKFGNFSPYFMLFMPTIIVTSCTVHAMFMPTSCMFMAWTGYEQRL